MKKIAVILTRLSGEACTLFVGGKKSQCIECDGSGRVLRPSLRAYDTEGEGLMHSRLYECCHACKGSGKVILLDRPSPYSCRKKTRIVAASFGA